MTKQIKYNWSEIQEYYNQGHTWREIQEKFGTAQSTLHNARKRGDLITVSKSEAMKLSLKRFPRKPHSEETRQKISEARIKFLIENPDKVPYLINHSSKKSYPEQLFENALNSSNITGWIYNYQNGIYQYDFAFPELRIDVEIDGGTHTTDKVKKIDERRDAFSKSEGWRVLRFTANRVKQDIIGCINDLKRCISDPILEIDTSSEFDTRISKNNKVRRPKKKPYIKKPRKRKIEWPTKEELSKLLWSKPTSHIAKDYGVSDNAVGKWAKKYILEKPPRGYWEKLYHEKTQ